MRSSRTTLATFLFATLVACGDDGTNKLADAPATGSGSDGTVSGTPVRMLVTVDGVPTAGAKVYFLNADSSVVSNTMTGSDGTASAVMADGGSVTVIEPAIEGQADQLDTWLDVKGGDQLTDTIVTMNATGTGITFNVTVPVDTNENVATYEFDSTCGSVDISSGAGSGSGSGSGSAALKAKTHHRFATPVVTNAPVSVELDDCPSGKADVVIATRDSNGVLLDTIVDANQAVANGVDLTINGPYVAATPSETVTFSNLGSTLTDAFEGRVLITANGLLSESNEDGVDVTLTAGAGTGSITSPPVTAVTEVLAGDFENLNAFESQSNFSWRAAGSNAFTYDGSTQFLPHFTADPAFDPTANAITETFDSTDAGATPDAVLTGADFDRAGSGSGSDHEWDWYVVAPGTDVASVAYPTLPTDVFDYKGTATDTVDVFQVTTQTFPGGYAAFHLDPYGAPTDLTTIVTASASGDVQFNDYQEQAEGDAAVRRTASSNVKRAAMSHLKPSKKHSHRVLRRK